MAPVSMTAERGSTFTRIAIATALHRGYTYAAAEYARERWPDTPAVDLFISKAAVAVGTSANTPLVAPGAGELLGLVRPRTILGRLSRARRVPLVDGVALQTAGATYQWIGENAPHPVGRLTFASASLPALKAGGIVVLTEGLLRNSTPAAEAVVRDELVDGLVRFHDAAFINPALAAVAGVSPASITNGIVATVSTGNPADDVTALLSGFADLDGVSIVASEHALIAIANALPGALQGGRLHGIVPVVASSAAGTSLVAIHEPSIMLGDDGAIEVDAARAATLQMDDSPDNPLGAATVQVSLWQNGLVGLKVTRFMNWARRNAAAVAVVSGASY
jgi:hypothetical protein